ncbi:hypothetical protein JHK85_006495 [Glycine max]|uniref:Uncharacterized protein n=1 Tax=Glycine soja TaxID=3848 RepID=A0A0B2SKQ3_GLYSO|nr:hypothetical protein JHK85_006495 [Glycine max]KHN44899.1 hypothetical protein glysoja_042929 [Glycine soja]
MRFFNFYADVARYNWRAGEREETLSALSSSSFDGDERCKAGEGRIQRLKKEIDSLRRPTVELHESETSAALKNLLEERERMPTLLVFSSETAFNGIVEELKNFTTHVAHVLPISDDGGSTGEIGEELGILIDWVQACIAGGPVVGDIRSRMMTLVWSSSAIRL